MQSQSQSQGAQQQQQGGYGLATGTGGNADQTKPAVQKAREKPEHEQAGEDISTAAPQTIQESDIISLIERLAELRQKDILTEEEFATKKAELLSKL